jgi:hypothetical protein
MSGGGVRQFIQGGGGRFSSRLGGLAMKRKEKLQFDSKVFLSKVNGGRTITEYRKDKIVFSQGEVADAVFYIQKGKIKLTVISERGSRGENRFKARRFVCVVLQYPVKIDRNTLCSSLCVNGHNALPRALRSPVI